MILCVFLLGNDKDENVENDKGERERERERFITSKPLVITTIIQDDEMENMPKLRSYLILKKIILLHFRISSIIHGGLGLMLARTHFFSSLLKVTVFMPCLM